MFKRTPTANAICNENGSEICVMCMYALKTQDRIPCEAWKEDRENKRGKKERMCLTVYTQRNICMVRRMKIYRIYYEYESNVH